VGIIALSLSLLALFWLLLSNLQSVADQVSEQVGISAQLSPKISVSDQKKIQERIRSWPSIQKAELVTSTAAMDWLKITLGTEASVLEGLPADLLPASIEIDVMEMSIDDAQLLVAKLEKLGGVAAVQFGQEEIQRIHGALELVRTSMYFLAVFLSVAILLILSNAIRLAVYARKDEIEVMSLIGGTRWFILFPFVLEGVLLGLLGGLMAIAILSVFKKVFLEWLQWGLSQNYGNLQIEFLDSTALIFILLIGATIGLLGSSYAAFRYIKL
jgi:cell division transport system permease protein